MCLIWVPFWFQKLFFCSFRLFFIHTTAIPLYHHKMRTCTNYGSDNKMRLIYKGVPSSGSYRNRNSILNPINLSSLFIVKFFCLADQWWIAPDCFMFCCFHLLFFEFNYIAWFPCKKESFNSVHSVTIFGVIEKLKGSSDEMFLCLSWAELFQWLLQKIIGTKHHYLCWWGVVCTTHPCPKCWMRMCSFISLSLVVLLFNWW